MREELEIEIREMRNEKWKDKKLKTKKFNKQILITLKK